MAYDMNPIFSFDTSSEVGINKLPLGALILVENIEKLYKLDSLNNLTDFTTIQTAITNNNLLDVGGDSNVVNLDDLGDVDLTTNPPSNGQTLKWDGSTWIPGDDEAGGGGGGGDMFKSTYDIDNDGVVDDAKQLDGHAASYFLNTNSKLKDLVDVSSTTPNNGQVLKWNGTSWTPGDDEAGSGGGGDMFKSTYDTNDNGIVDNSEQLGGHGASYFLNSNSELDDLSDVNTSGASNGQVLKFNGSTWAPGTDETGGSGGGGDMYKSTYDTNNNGIVDDSEQLGGHSASYYLNTNSAISDLSDVNTSGASNGQVLKYNGSNWVPDTDETGGSLNLDDLLDVEATFPATYSSLKYDGTGDWKPYFSGGTWYQGTEGTINYLYGDIASYSKEAPPNKDSWYDFYISVDSDHQGDLTDENSWQEIPMARYLNSVLSYDIGSGGDFEDLNEALAFISRHNVEHPKAITFNILSGFVQTTPIIIRGQNFGHVTLTGARLDFNVSGAAIQLYSAVFPFVSQGISIITNQTLAINLQSNSTINGSGAWSIQNSGTDSTTLVVGHGSIFGLRGNSSITFSGGDPWYAHIGVHVNSTLHVGESGSIDFGPSSNPDAGIYSNGGSSVILNHVAIDPGGLGSGSSTMRSYLGSDTDIWGCTFAHTNTDYDLRMYQGIGHNRIHTGDTVRCNVPSGTVTNNGFFTEVA
jgi:hypothetical protein